MYCDLCNNYFDLHICISLTQRTALYSLSTEYYSSAGSEHTNLYAEIVGLNLDDIQDCTLENVCLPFAQYFATNSFQHEVSSDFETQVGLYLTDDSAFQTSSLPPPSPT